tara:strand:- start:12 stop:488 length:477 start_codon:yes stop_codon:yes gene_type:complete
MTRAQGLSDFAAGLGDTLKIDGDNNRVGINSTVPTQALDVVGNITASGNITAGGNLSITGTIPASKLTGTLPAIDGSQLTGVSGFADALSSDQTSPLNKFFKTPTQVNIGAGTSITVESDAASGNVAFVRESIIHVAAGATFHVKTNTALATNVLGVF